MLSYPHLLKSRSGFEGLSRGSRSYFGCPGHYGYYHLKALEKLVRFIYSNFKKNEKMQRNLKFLFWIEISSLMTINQTLRQTSWRQFQGLQGKARIREKRPKRALEELGGTP